jgi:predicted O-linked N-acetylglucosamine transferase (SPINDLY family)
VLDNMPMISGLLLYLDQNLFETVYLCPGNKTKSPESKLWFERANNAVVYSSTNVNSAIKTIAAQKLDIIISGPSVPHIFYPMLSRLASLQMILLEPNWMDGTKNLDYYISWKKAEPKNPNNLYKSKVAFLEHPPYWIEKPLTFDQVCSRLELNQFRKRLLNIKTQQRIYLCANTPPKIHPKMDDAFKAILDKDKLAILVFLRSDYVAVDIIKNRLSLKLGTNYKRVKFLPTLSQKDAHLLAQVADCCLDSFPICGMSSSFDASILGVPIVTFPHKNSFGSWTAAIYKHIGIEGLIAKNTKEYVNISLKLASNKEWRNKISNEIKNKSSVFIENKSAADEFQSFIIKAWERRCNGLSPQNFV